MEYSCCCCGSKFVEVQKMANHMFVFHKCKTEESIQQMMSLSGLIVVPPPVSSSEASSGVVTNFCNCEALERSNQFGYHNSQSGAMRMHAKPAAGTVPKNLTTKPFKAVKKTKKLSKAMASTSLHPIMIDTPSSPCATASAPPTTLTSITHPTVMDVPMKKSNSPQVTLMTSNPTLMWSVLPSSSTMTTNPSTTFAIEAENDEHPLPKPSTFAPGQLVYAKMTGHPWWPGVVKSVNQFTGVYVYFFGDDEMTRSWIKQPKHVKPYTSDDQPNVLLKIPAKLKSELKRAREWAEYCRDWTPKETFDFFILKKQQEEK